MDAAVVVFALEDWAVREGAVQPRENAKGH